MISIPQNALRSGIVVDVAREHEKVILPKENYPRIINTYKFINKLKDTNKPVYGVTTGFGALASVILSRSNLKQLQKNLILSHSVGSGSMLDKEIVRAAMFLRANMLSKGHSGVRVELINTLLTMLNKDIVPLVPETGSVGASGDLSPLAFIARTLLGYGEVYYHGKIMKALSAFTKVGLKPIVLEPKEGLSLINGTEVMTATGSLVINKTQFLAKVADIAAVMSIIALQGKTEPFDIRLIQFKPHNEQIAVIKNLTKLLTGYQTTRKKVQDSYSLRCIPQVAGAVRQGMKFAQNIIETEMNSVTDNPIIVHNKKNKDYHIISGGNFHGQSISLAFDTLGISLTTMGLISERRIFRLLDDKLSGLSPFLVKEPGVNSGLMMLQVLASGLCAENKVLSNPASIQSLPTSASQEDFVSMGMTAANKTRRILDNTVTIIAIELICSRQAIELAKYKVPIGIARFYNRIAKTIPYITDDRLFQDDIINTKKLLQNNEFQKLVNNEIF
jgi:histidine ammonia-lyase